MVLLKPAAMHKVHGALALTKRPSLVVATDDPEDPNIMKERFHQETIEKIKHVLLFSQGAAEALYDNQMIMSLDVLQKLDNNTIKDLQETRRGCSKILDFQAVHDPPQVLCLLGKAHVTNLKGC
jgi:hypothetical protein